MTCGDPKCKREWHRRKCAEWNRKNADYFKTNYLAKKLEAVTQPEQISASSKPKNHPIPLLKSRLKSGLPQEKVQEVIGVEHHVIIEYLAQLLLRRFQEVIMAKVAVKTGEMGQLPPKRFQDPMDSNLGLEL
jgi:hypothetical protein